MPKFKPRSSILRNSGLASTSSSSESFQKATASRKDRLDEQEHSHSQKNTKSSADLHRSKSFSRSEPVRSEESRSELKRSKSFDRGNGGGFDTSNPYFRGLNSSSQETSKEACLSRDLNKLKQFYENLCHAKDKQLETMRLAHQRRLERLISLEKQYKLLKDHLRSYVDDEGKTGVY